LEHGCVLLGFADARPNLQGHGFSASAGASAVSVGWAERQRSPTPGDTSAV